MAETSIVPSYLNSHDAKVWAEGFAAGHADARRIITETFALTTPPTEGADAGEVS